MYPHISADANLTPSSISTIPPQPTKDYFKDAEIISVGYLRNNQLLVVLETVSELAGEYFASIGEELYNCEILNNYPNRLYCNGKSNQTGVFEVFIIHSKESETEV